MNTNLQDRIHFALNSEYCKRLLVKYFKQKGFTEDFTKRIYPPSIQDIVMNIPQLKDKIEIEPFVEDMDANTGSYKIGWNMFVLGNHRIYLGTSTHTNFMEIKTAIGGPLDGGASRCTFTTPKRIINFIINTLKDSKKGVINTGGNRMVAPTYLGIGDSSGYFKTQHRPVY